MIINKIGFGNFIEAFIEDRLHNGVNIIFSDDNNKGKTLVVQGLMYSLGNEPIFPSGFPAERYYFYSQIEINGENIEFLRRKNSVVIKYRTEMHIFGTISEMKYFLKSENIINLPTITKDGHEVIADLSLFYEMFFVGQDKRNPSNIFNPGYNNKQDFLNMLYVLNGYPIVNMQMDNNKNQEKIKVIKSEINTTKKMLKLLKTNLNLSSYIDKFSDDLLFLELRDKLKITHQNIGEYKKKRTAEINRKIRLEILIEELNSLNRTIEKGKIICADCGSDRITYLNRDLSFDVSSPYVRGKILNSIKFQIDQKEEIVTELTRDIHIEQDKLKEILKEIPEEMQKILLFSEEILSSTEYDNKLTSLNEELRRHMQYKNSLNASSEISKKQGNNMIDAIVKEMNTLYLKIDPNGGLVFDDLFTKKNITYSGSEEQEYYYCRLLALNSYFEHEFPLIIDCYRSGEISTRKEEIMIETFKKTEKQVILTSTLKTEEYIIKKYDKYINIKVLDYSVNQDSKILNQNHAKEMSEILNGFGIINV